MKSLIKPICFGVSLFFFWSCKEELLDMNINPNGVNPDTANPNLVLSTVLTETGKAFLNLGYQDIAGVMQHTQKDGWTSGHNVYDWDRNNSWSGYYAILRNNQYVYERAVEMDQELHQGVALVMKSMVFGLITDLWGDAPYSQALKGALGGAENTFPVFDPQGEIYRGILEDLEKANQLLSKPKTAYNGDIDIPDVYYGGDPVKWRKLANSLKLRYYMRISDKLPDEAQAGIESILAHPDQYPIILSSSEEASMGFTGTSADTSWPATTRYDPSESNYRRLKMCETLVEAMRAKKDPRLQVWATRVQIPLVVDSSLPKGTDKIENGKRYLSPDILEARNVQLEDINQNEDYVGIPPGISGPQVYNMSPDANQASTNPHVSWLNETYKEANGPMLKARLMSASEVYFILAEAAVKGWAVGEASSLYQQAIQSSFETWGLESSVEEYLVQPPVVFDGTIRQIIEQKWIASWTAAVEAWFDYRRTGYPELKAGPFAIRDVLPVRFYYMLEERNLNPGNAETAIGRLEKTDYSEADGSNSAWSKPWLIQGTGKPW